MAASTTPLMPHMRRRCEAKQGARHRAASLPTPERRRTTSRCSAAALAAAFIQHSVRRGSCSCRQRSMCVAERTQQCSVHLMFMPPMQHMSDAQRSTPSDAQRGIESTLKRRRTGSRRVTNSSFWCDDTKSLSNAVRAAREPPTCSSKPEQHCVRCMRADEIIGATAVAEV